MPPMLRSRPAAFIAVKLASPRRPQIRLADLVAFFAMAGVLCWHQVITPMGVLSPQGTFTVINANDSGTGSLRQAILDANDAPGPDIITFAIPSGCQIPPCPTRTINLLSPLPTLTDPVLIDGYSQPFASPNTLAVGNNAVLLIELNGAGAGTGDGLAITAGSCTIRGLVINGFNGSAISLATNGGNIIEGNFLGTNAAGTAAISNSRNGIIVVGSSHNTIGGLSSGTRNVLSGNQLNGISIETKATSSLAERNIVQGNYVGTTSTGNARLANGNNGVLITDSNNNTIGPANLISGNSFSGISLKGAAATANLLQGNLVGTNAAGTGAIGNNLNGIELIDAQGNTIGGSTVVADNTIAFNAQDGIEIINGNGNLIGPNSIFSNAMLGIDLSPNGVTPNDQGDSDKGANDLQNFPVLTSVVNSGGNTVVQGTLNSTPKTTFNIQVFSNASCDSSGNGEGQTIRGSTSVTTNVSGNATINLTIPTFIAAQFTATATDPNNNTSEFSACRLSTPETFLQFSSANFSASEAPASTAITVTRSGGSSGAASVQFSIAGGGSATGGTSCTQGVDYVNTSGTLQWADGETGNKTFPITICNDVTFEGNETVNLALANSVGATLGAQSTAVFTLNDNDSQPTISINDLTRSEGNSGTTTFAFAVSLSNPSSQTITVNYATADGTANAIGDYQPISPATLTFSPGITSRPIDVLVIDDTLNESNETFFVNLANATNAAIADNQCVGTITNDDPVSTGTLKISGRLVDDSARSIAGAIVFLGGAASGSKVTDSSGNYSFTNLNPGNYTVAPAVGLYSYSPANYIFNNLARDRVANFVGTQMIVSITGRVTDSNDVGLGGVTLGLIRNGAPAGTTSTDVLGNYGFGSLSARSNYVVTPVGSFTPGRLFFNALTTNTIGNFRSLPIVSPGSAVISGQVLDPDSNPIANATLTLSGPITGVTSTDAGGNYAFLNLTAGGNYAVTIQNSQYVFAPSRADFFNLASAQTFNLIASPAVVPEPTPDPSDDFTSDTRDPNKWSLGILTQPPENFDPQVTVTQGSGRLVITPLTQAPGMQYNGYVSANAFDMTNGSVSVELAGAADGGADSVFAIGTDRNNFYRFMVRTAGPSAGPAMMIRGIDGVERSLDTTVSQLLFQIVVAGQLTTLPIPYVESQHRHLRFRHESPIMSPPFGAIVFEASPDPEQFDYTVLHRTNLMSRVLPNMTTELSAGTSAATNPGQTVFRNYMLVTSTVQFSNAAYTVEEGGGSVLISVTRSGNILGVDAVDYATADGTASQTTRYINTAGRLMFGPGEASQTFRVLIIDNALTEGNQNLNLLLRNPLNAGLNTPGRAVLTINDNDTTEPTTNPLDDPTRYVQQHYYDFLSREPDAPGLAFWVDQITQCGAVTQCVEIRRINVSAAYFLSAEFQNTGFLAYRFYNLALNRPNGLPRYLEFLRDTQALARGVIGGAPGSEAILEANKIAYANEFVAREEFTGLYPLSQAPAEYVDAIYARAGITPSSAERQTAIDEFDTPAGAHGRVLRRVAENENLINRERNRAFVLAQYFGYLRRNPDDAPDNNLDGYNFWMGKLNQFNGNFVNAEMVKAFITSPEYRHRFGP